MPEVNHYLKLEVSNFFTWADRGIDGYLGPDMSAHELLSTMRRVAASDSVCPPRRTTLFFNHVAGRTNVRTTEAGIFDLTTREREIAELLADGLSNIRIAHQLHLARSTVKNHVHSILEKWGVRNRGEAAARYHREMHCNLKSSSQESAGLHSNVQSHQVSQV